jgi:hypothetical protein
MIRRTLVALALSLVAFTAVGVVVPADAQQAEDSIGISLVDAPEERRDDPRAQTYIVDHLGQGATITRHVRVISTIDTPTTVQLYVAAASLEEGQFVFGDGRAENDLTDWSVIDPPQVEVPPNGDIEAAITIAVPTDATNGERYGVIWAELPASGGSASIVNRVGVRIYLSIGEGEEPASDFTIETLTAGRTDDGTPIVETTVTNTGGRAIDLSGSLMLENGPGSLNAGPFDVQIGTTLAPGKTAPARVLLDPSLPDGPWDATITIQSGRLSHTAEGRITFPEEAGEKAEPVPAADKSEPQRKVLIPIAAGAAVAAGAASSVFFLRRRALQLAKQAGRAVRG